MLTMSVRRRSREFRRVVVVAMAVIVSSVLKEEQRRFEILQAHWDVPINDVPLNR